ncbi:MAG TPA: hypothetical protein VFU23_05670, partial [Gemmatimonadales bacterium]|nr:hypothetical protein [Gemmatimonadales bacterium]
ALPQQDVSVMGKDSSRVVLRGPSIRVLMTVVGAPEGHELRGPNLLLVVVAEAADGYKVAYSLAELDQQFGARTAIIALTQNGAPLPAEGGPFQAAVPGEEHHARWIRQVTRLTLVRVGR